jgi:hypothetical protein
MKLLRIVPVLPLALLLAASPLASADAPKAGSGAGSAAPAPSGGTVSDADVKKWLAFWDKLVDTFVSNKGNCPKMGTDINALIDANKDLMTLAQNAVSGGKQLPPDALQHMKDTAPKMIGAAMACKDDANVKAAIARLKFTRPQSK